MILSPHTRFENCTRTPSTKSLARAPLKVSNARKNGQIKKDLSIAWTLLVFPHLATNRIINQTEIIANASNSWEAGKLSFVLDRHNKIDLSN